METGMSIDGDGDGYGESLGRTVLKTGPLMTL